AAFAQHQQREVRGWAGYALALSLIAQAERLHSSNAQSAADSSRQAERYLDQVASQYADIPNGQSTLGKTAQTKLYALRYLAIGREAPEIEGEDLAGKNFRLSDYRGQVVVVNFWGNWCGWCRQMYPQERSLMERFKGRPFAMLGVNSDRDKAAVLDVLKK